METKPIEDAAFMQAASTESIRMKMEHESITAMAHAKPRDMKQVWAAIKEQLQLFKSFAEEAMYAKPVGKDPKSGKMKYARGLSIRAAEAIAAAYRYNRTRANISIVDHDHAKIEAVFIDYCDGRVWEASTIVSKIYKAAGGKRTARHPDDRFFDVVCKAAASKLIRDCILRMVPPGLISEFERLVNDQLNQFLNEKTTAAIVANFSTKGVDEAMLERWADKRLENWTKEERIMLVGLWNALEQGEATVAELFSDASEPKGQDGGQGTLADSINESVENESDGRSPF